MTWRAWYFWYRWVRPGWRALYALAVQLHYLHYFGRPGVDYPEIREAVKRDKRRTSGRG